MPPKRVDSSQIRKRILEIYNKTEDMFDKVKDYDDYLEEIEDIIYNLANKIDSEETERKIQEYKGANEGLIVEQNTENKKKMDKIRKEIDAEIESFEKRIKKYGEQDKNKKQLSLDEKWLEVDEDEVSKSNRERKIERNKADIAKEGKKLKQSKARDALKSAPQSGMRKQDVISRPLPKPLGSTKLTGKLTPAQISAKRKAEGYSSGWIISTMIQEMFSSLILKSEPESSAMDLTP